MPAETNPRHWRQGSRSGRPGPRSLALLVATGAFAVGCSDSAGPCDRPHACEIDGPDLAIVAAEVLADSGYLSTGVPVAVPEAIRVAYVVRNRGSEAAPAAAVTGRVDVFSKAVRDTLPVLAPGDSVAGLLTVEWTTRFLGWHGAQDSIAVELRIEEAFDSDSTNDVRPAWMHPAVPLLLLDFPDPGLPRVRVNEPFEVRFTITNRSERITAAGYAAWLCVAQYGDLCFPGNFAPTAPSVLPDLEPGEVFAGHYMAKIEPPGAWQDESTQGWITMCIRPAGWVDPYLGIGHYCTGGGFLRVMPDYEGACAPPLLVPGVPITLTEHNCGLMPLTAQGDTARSNYLIRLHNIHLFAADLQAGRTYRLDWAGKPRNFLFADGDGDHDGFQLPDTPIVAPRDGRYYFPVLSWADPVVTVMLLEE